MNILEVKNLTFRYRKNFVFDNFNLNVQKGTWLTIAGPNGSGKSTLVKLLAGLYKNYSCITILGLNYNHKNIDKIRQDVGFVFDNPDNFFACETVSDELAFSLENMAVAPKTIKKKLDEVSSLLGLESIMDKDPFELSGGEKKKVALGCALMLEPRVLIIDEGVSMTSSTEQEKIMKVLKMYHDKKNVTIISFTHDLDEALFSDRLIILNDGKIIVDGDAKTILQNQEFINKVGLEAPFEVELSYKLMKKGLTSNLEFDLEKLVNDIWK